MKKKLLGVFTVIALAFGASSFAACPCGNSPCTCPTSPCNNPCMSQNVSPCDNPCAKKKCDPCSNIDSEAWLSSTSLQEYFCQLGFTDCQKQEAMNAIEEFKCKTKDIRMSNNGCQTESKCDCRTYRRALKDLDCKMKHIVTSCQKDEYKDVRQSVKEQVKCAHKCMINPFSRCKTSCN